ncbi:hypothetical protein E2C01_062280 [Portunus trituberculatus]|uniref:Uncharacterized protein n=1 Tax=Portunus trituberculatus TaxID=210409 RepID=A0A5B7HGV4_PORTR|nr:hypothetical protein [Portunus trituberculatus]
MEENSFMRRLNSPSYPQ